MRSLTHCIAIMLVAFCSLFFSATATAKQQLSINAPSTSQLSEVITVYAYHNQPNGSIQQNSIHTSYINNLPSSQQIIHTLSDGHTGKQLQKIDNQQHSIIYQYDDLLRQTAVSYSDQQTHSIETKTLTYQITPQGFSVTATYPLDPLLHKHYVTKTNYDSLGRQLARYDNDDNSTTTTQATHLLSHRHYNDLGQMSQQSKQGIVLAFSYDARGRKTTTSQITNGIQTIRQYDDVANRITQFSQFTDAHGQVTLSAKVTQTLNDAGKPVLQSQPTHTQGNLYNAVNYDNFNDAIAHNLERKNQRLRLQSTSSYNALGQVKQIHLLASSSTDTDTTVKNTYDFNANLISKQLATGTTQHRSYQLVYDANKHLLQESLVGDANTSAISKHYHYDNDGNLQSASFWHPDTAKKTAIETTYRYQWVLGKYVPKCVSTTQGKTICHDYDIANGRLLKTYFSDGSGAIDYQYSLNGKRIQTTYPDGKSITYHYNSEGNLDTLTNAAGVIMDYHYDASQRLQQITASTALSNSVSHPISRVTYDYTVLGKPHQVVSLRFQDGQAMPVQTTLYHYNADNSHLLSIERKEDNGNPIEKTNYQYDNNGNINDVVSTNQTGAEKHVVFSYDNLNRLQTTLTTLSNSNGDQQEISGLTRVYSLNGNLVNQLVNSVWVGRHQLRQSNHPNPSYTYNAEDQLQTVFGTAINYQSGNMLNDDKGNHYDYYPNHQLKSITDKQGQRISFTYGADGRLATETQSDNTLHFYFSGSQLIDEADAQGNMSSYLMGWHREARFVTDSKKQLQQLSFYGQNQHGDTTSFSTDKNNKINRTFYDDDSYGNRTDASARTENPTLITYNAFQYSGEFTIGDLQYLRARWLDTHLHHFLTRDSYQLMNRYGDCDDNPVMKSDPSGHNSMLNIASLFNNGEKLFIKGSFLLAMSAMAIAQIVSLPKSQTSKIPAIAFSYLAGIIDNFAPANWVLPRLGLCFFNAALSQPKTITSYYINAVTLFLSDRLSDNVLELKGTKRLIKHCLAGPIVFLLREDIDETIDDLGSARRSFKKKRLLKNLAIDSIGGVLEGITASFLSHSMHNSDLAIASMDQLFQSSISWIK